MQSDLWNQQGSKYIFSASTTNISHIFKLLRSIGAVARDVLISISEQGLSFTASNSTKTCYAKLLLSRNLFTSYYFINPSNQSNLGDDESHERDHDSDPTRFSVPLADLIGCLQMFSSDLSESSINASRARDELNDDSASNASCRMAYQGIGHPFILMFTQGDNMTTKCQFSTHMYSGILRFGQGEDEHGETDDAGPARRNDIDEIPDLGFNIDPSHISQKIIIKGPLLADAIKELESVNTSILTIRSSLQAPHFILRSQGEFGISQLVFPNEKSVLESFVVNTPEDSDHVAHSYLFELVDKSKEIVSKASKVSLRCDESGIMSIQSMCEAGNGHYSFVDFRFLPKEDES